MLLADDFTSGGPEFNSLGARRQNINRLWHPS
jgi:hypothetical protein